MCWAELIGELQRHGVFVSESQLRWVIRTGKVARPEMDGGYRFKFTEENVAELVEHFGRQDAPVEA